MSERNRRSKMMTQKQLRKIAREYLAKFLKGEDIDFNRKEAAVSILHAPDRKGE